MFNKETYMARRATLKKAVGSGLLLFLGNDECGMNYMDNAYHFRQDSTFLYFFGLPYAGLSAIIDIDNNKEIIFGDELTIDAIVWMGTQPTLKEKSEAAGIHEVRPFKEIESYLNNTHYVEDEVVTDGHITTSRGPATTFAFAYRLVDLLGGDSEALKEGMLYNKYLKK